MSNCDSCVGVEAEHHLCDECVQDDIAAERALRAERDAARAEVEQWEKAASVLPGMDNPRSPQDLMDVSAKLRDLEAEVERLKSVQQAAFNDAHRAEADNARLREALRLTLHVLGYTQHDSRCFAGGPHYDGCVCHPWLQQARAALAEKETP